MSQPKTKMGIFVLRSYAALYDWRFESDAYYEMPDLLCNVCEMLHEIYSICEKIAINDLNLNDLYEKGRMEGWLPKEDIDKPIVEWPGYIHFKHLYGGSEVKIKRNNPTIPLPKYQTQGSVGFDLSAKIDVHIAPKEIALISVNTIIEVPKGYMLQISLRSSIPRRYGLIMPHGVGIIDQDYCGPNDTIMVQVMNITDQLVVIKRGTRIAQGVFIKVACGDEIEWNEVEEMAKPTRGGFGSTGI